MLKRHCDLCDSVIKDFQTHYSLIKKTHKMFIYEAESTEF